MSTWFDEDVTCPDCGAVQLARLAHGVHVGRAPEVREQIFARTFHGVTCASCGGTFVARRTVIYTDADRKHWVWVAMVDERARWPELETATKALFARAFTGSPLAAAMREGFKVRLVFGFEELREKLVVWGAGLDDAVVECLKVELVARDPLRSREAMIVDRAHPDSSLDVRIGDTVVTISAADVDRASSDGRLAERFPELFGGRYVSVFRLFGPRYRRGDGA